MLLKKGLLARLQSHMGGTQLLRSAGLDSALLGGLGGTPGGDLRRVWRGQGCGTAGGRLTGAGARGAPSPHSQPSTRGGGGLLA